MNETKPAGNSNDLAEQIELAKQIMASSKHELESIVTYIVDKQGHPVKTNAYEARLLVDNRNWFYTDKQVYYNYVGTSKYDKKFLVPNLIKKGAIINGKEHPHDEIFHCIVPMGKPPKEDKPEPKEKRNNNFIQRIRITESRMNEILLSKGVADLEFDSEEYLKEFKVIKLGTSKYYIKDIFHHSLLKRNKLRKKRK